MRNPLKKRNLRDLSYLANDEGFRLVPGHFFRSGALNSLNRREKKAIEALNLTNIYDLRTPEEVSKKPDEKVGDFAYTLTSIVQSELLGITHEKGLKGYKSPPNMPKLYRQIVENKPSIEAIEKALKEILSTSNGPRLWHCSAGKDRAGIITALFLLALGYSEEDVLRDYELSDKPNRRKGRLYQVLILLLLWKKELANGVYQAMRADRAYLLAAFDAMKEKAGSVQNYIASVLHISSESIVRFKEKYMVRVS